MALLKPGNLVGGKYELIGRLGQGAMGEVWSARHTELDARVAIKLMRTQGAGSGGSRARFSREARIAASLQSDAIVRVFDHGAHEGLLFMAMDLLEGEDLHKRLRREKRLPIPFVMRIAVAVGRALRAAHSAGLVHRDLKPANVFLAMMGGEEVIKVLDFGIAKLQGATMYTPTGEVLGTVAYMSPEHMRYAKGVDSRADLWSLAVILYTALSNEHPFPGSTYQVFLTLAKDPIPPPVPISSHAPELRPFDRFFERAFAPKIQERFQTAHELIGAFCSLSAANAQGGDTMVLDGPADDEPVPQSTALTLSLSGESIDLSPDELITHPVLAEGAPDAPLSAETLRDVLRGERYSPIAELGRGGMGRVDFVLDRALGRTVAQKTAYKDANIPLLLAEAQIGAQLEHPSIVPVYDVQVDSEGRPHYIMRVVRGVTLRDALDGRRMAIRQPADAIGGFEESTQPLSLSQMLGVLRQVCLAVEYAHSRGVVHRDLKPENIIIGPFGEVYVLDWGVSWVSPMSDLTGAARLPVAPHAGTPGYMAPEQLSQSPFDHTVDIYTLGVIARELLTGERPSRTQGDLTHLSADIPITFREVLPACLDSERQKRPKSARVLADAIETFLDGEQVREEREREADMYAIEGLAHRETVERFDSDARILATRAHDELSALKPWESLASKQAAWELFDNAEELRGKAAHALANAEAAFARALGRSPNHTASRRGLTALYVRQFETAEDEGDSRRMVQYLELARAYDDGTFALVLSNHGQLEVRTEPSECDVEIAHIEQKGLLLRASAPRPLSSADRASFSLISGSYVIIARLGNAEIRYPLVIERAHRHVLKIRFRNARTCPHAMILIAGGPFLTLTTRAPRGERARLTDFAIARYPTTFGEYAQFLDSLSPEERALRMPTHRGEALLIKHGNKWALSPHAIEGEGRARVPLENELNVPVFAVSYYDASAFAAWLAETTGKPYRLPSQLEWEKAARGADGRLFPCGRRFDPSLAKMRESRPEATQPEPIGSFPADESPYGVRDMMGGVGDWTASPADGRPLPDIHAENTREAHGRQAYYCGGHWGTSSLARMRYPTELRTRSVGIGFRVAYSLSPKESSDLTVTKLR